MSRELQAHLREQCPDIPDDVLDDFLGRMDPDYFATFDAADVACHLRAAASLDPEHPARIDVEPKPTGMLRVIVIAYDYISEFAMICGVLSAFGLDIREAAIFTSLEASEPASVRRRGPTGKKRRSSVTSRRYIIDVFQVLPTDGIDLFETQRTELASMMEQAIRLLDGRRFADARRLVNRRLIETLGKRHEAASALLEPVEIRFDSTVSPGDTVMDIRSADTPAFLYTFGNALAMRGLYIRKAWIRSVGAEAHDRFYVRDRLGRTVDDAAQREELRLTATLMKQFTHFLPNAPDPSKALEAFDRFLDVVMASDRPGTLAALRQKHHLTLLAKLLGSSEFLWEEFLRRQHANLLPLLDRYQHGELIRNRRVLQRALRRKLAAARGVDARRRVINQFKDQELFRIDMKHLLDPATSLPDFSAALTELAEAVIEETARACAAALARIHGTPKAAGTGGARFAVCALGKFGGRELGYASDIEVLFVYSGGGRTSGRQALDAGEYFERLTQEVLRWIEAKQEGIFHLDVRLRPHGGKGLLANSLEELRHYYSAEGSAAPWERQALIKLRPVAGDITLGRAVAEHRDAFVYSERPWDLREAVALRGEQIRELVQPGSINIKYSPGGLLDVEYAVQYLQLMHGHATPGVRTPNTLEAIDALKAAGIIGRTDAAILREGYLFFRRLIDGLRIVRGHAKDLVLPPPDSDAFVFLARRIGYTSESWAEGAKKLEGDVTRFMTWTRDFYDTRFGGR